MWAHGLLLSMAHEDEAGVFDWSGVTSHHRLVRYDARSHGDSEGTPAAADHTWPHLANDMLAIADAVHADRFVAGGASMGCATALHAAVGAPKRVRALVLVIPPTAGGGRRLQAAGYRVGGVACDIGVSIPFAFAGRLLPRRSARRGTRAALFAAGSDTLFRTDRHRLAVVLHGASRSDLPVSEQLRAIDAPALILAWEHDRTHPLSTARMLAELMPNTALHVAGDDDAIAAWPSLVDEFLREESWHPSR